MEKTAETHSFRQLNLFPGKLCGRHLSCKQPLFNRRIRLCGGRTTSCAIVLISKEYIQTALRTWGAKDPLNHGCIKSCLYVLEPEISTYADRSDIQFFISNNRKRDIAFFWGNVPVQMLGYTLQCIYDIASKNKNSAQQSLLKFAFTIPKEIIQPVRFIPSALAL